MELVDDQPAINHVSTVFVVGWQSRLLLRKI